MQIEELIATLIASVKTLTSSIDENNRLLRAAGVSAPAEKPAPEKPKKTKTELVVVEKTPEPEPEVDELDPVEKDTTDYLEETRKTVMEFRKENPDKAPANKAAYSELLKKFNVDKLADVGKDIAKDFYLAVKAIC